jgi:hypothetical protein
VYAGLPSRALLLFHSEVSFDSNFV